MFRNTAASFIVSLIFFSNLFKDDREQFLFINTDEFLMPQLFSCCKTTIKSLSSLVNNNGLFIVYTKTTTTICR